MQRIAPGEVLESRTERQTSEARKDRNIEPHRLCKPRAVDMRKLKRIDVNVKDVIVTFKIDDRPLLDRAQLNALIDVVRIKDAAVDRKRKFLPVCFLFNP